MSQKSHRVADASDRSWFGAICSMIVALCVALIRLFGLFSKGVDYLDTEVEALREQQVIRLTQNKLQYERDARHRAVLKEQRSRDALLEYIAAGATDAERAERQKRVQESSDRLKAAVDAELAKLRASRADF